MPSVDEVPVVAERLRAALGPARTVYEWATPAGVLPDRYVLVSGSSGVGDSTNAAEIVDQREPVVFVVCVARDESEQKATREAGWAARRCVDALASWRTGLGRASWFPRHAASSPPRRDTDLPGYVVAQVEQFVCKYQP